MRIPAVAECKWAISCPCNFVNLVFSLVRKRFLRYANASVRSTAGGPCDSDRLRVLRVQLPRLRPGEPPERVDVRLLAQGVPLLPQGQATLSLEGATGEVVF